MINLDEAQKICERAQATCTGSMIAAEVRAAVSLLGLLIEDHRDALAAVKAPELHWECKQREEKLEEEIRNLGDRMQQLSDTSNYSIPGGRR